MQSLSGFIASISVFFGSTVSFFGTSEAICSRRGTRSVTRSFFTSRFRGSIVIPSRASSMQASTGSPFTRTAQDPHWPDEQE